MVDVFNELQIQKSLTTHTFGQNLYVFDKLDSTNQFAKRLIEQEAIEGTLVYSEYQTHGRGRWGKAWHSPSHKGLWFSLVLKPDERMRVHHLLTLLGAVSVAKTVENQLQLNVEVRWPNDLYIEGKKVGGILAETVKNPKKGFFVILGIGINVNQETYDFLPELKEKATSLKIVFGQMINRLHFFSQLICQLEKDYFDIKSNDTTSLLRAWIGRSDFLGKEVELHVNRHFIRGKVRGFYENGDIKLVDSGGRENRYSLGNIVEVKDDSCY